MQGEGLTALCDDKTIGVVQHTIIYISSFIYLQDDQWLCQVCVLGNHYAGQYDPVWEVDRELRELNERNGWQVIGFPFLLVGVCVSPSK